MNSAKLRRVAIAANFALVLVPTWSIASCAGELDGAWANERAMCDKMFANENGRARLVKNADFYGSGFVIERETIYGKGATCKIRSITKNRNNIHILATCATDVMVSNTQFDAALGTDGRLTRSFAGMPEMTLDYYRCEF